MMKNYQQINNDPFERRRRTLVFYDNVDGCEVEVNDC